ncbi:MAG TPA: NAD-dependent epimerase/dehydratase family protein [Trebonia sp.]|nr:NAD-dependent epimerase/dehydratase family protein [Trebonia sp.]
MGQGARGKVLVTGVTGYVAGFCVRELLEHGYAVRGTVRNAKTADVTHLRPLGQIELAQATLDDDAGWAQAVDGCDYVLHVASPIPFKAPKHEDELLRPAVDGTRRVLTAAGQAGIKRVVYTSTLDAATRNRATAGRIHTDEDWSDLAECNAYAKSKLLAEKAAWDLAGHYDLELAAVLPGAVIGPQFQLKVNKDSTSDLVRRILAGDMPAIPPISIAFSDVRDLAIAHRLAMEVPAAAGNRYICAGGPLAMMDIARILKEEYGLQGYRVSTRPVPPWVIKAAALMSDEAKLAADMLGAAHQITAEKARRDLGWVQRPLRQTILETAEHLIEQGIVHPKKLITAR